MRAHLNGPFLQALLLAVLAPGVQAQFGPGQALSARADGPSDVATGDLDGDGDLDVISSFFFEDTVAWYENVDGAGKLGPPRVVWTLADGAQSVHAADLDDDGDVDLLSASQADDELFWYANIDGQGTFSVGILISNTGDGVRSVFAADLDGDGDRDVLAAAFDDDQVAWYENTNGLATFGPEQLLPGVLDGATSVVAADLDGDGDQDVLATAELGDTLTRFVNDGQGGFAVGQTLAAPGAVDVAAADLDGDGDLDVAVGADDLLWFENTDGAGTLGAGQILPNTSSRVSSVAAVDFDGDGDADLVAAYTATAASRIARYENTDGLGTFVQKSSLPGLGIDDVPRGVHAADLDGDENQDVLATAFARDRVFWHANVSGSGVFGAARYVSILGAQAVDAGDLDGDGDLDLLEVVGPIVGWRENLDGLGLAGFAAPFTIDTAAVPPAPGSVVGFDVRGADLDGDGDRDAVAAFDSRVRWYENADGLGGAWQEATVSGLGDGSPRTVYPSDVDGDGDLDVVAGMPSDDEASWYENTDGAGGFGPQQIITQGVLGFPLSTRTADLDGDGDQDFLAGSQDNRITWFENNDGLGSFGPLQTIAGNHREPRSVQGADVDGDGDLDVMAGSGTNATFGTSFAWYRNLDGTGTSWSTTVIGTPSSADTVCAVDLDEDGDLDVLVMSQSGKELSWKENQNGLGSFGAKQVLDSGIFVGQFAIAADVDGDGDEDVVLTAADRFTWYENLVCCAMTPDLTTISLAAGGTQTLDLDAGPAKAFDLYWLLTTTTGTTPGLALAPAPLRLPLNFSQLLLFTVFDPNLLVANSVNVLDAAGQATASLTLPPGLDGSLAGLTLHHAYFLLDLVTFQADAVSEPVPLQLSP